MKLSIEENFIPRCALKEKQERNEKNENKNRLKNNNLYNPFLLYEPNKNIHINNPFLFYT